MTLLLFLTGLTTVASTTTPADTGLFAVSGGEVADKFQATAVSYTLAPTSRRTE